MPADLPANDFALYRDLLLRHSGLDLKPTQVYLVVSRLTPLAKALGLEGGLPALTAALRAPAPPPELMRAVVEAMTTNETSFFRDAKPFAALAEILPALVRARGAPSGTVRVWSAACSSGQEAYSIAMTAAEALAAHPGWRCDILGTDIDAGIVERARTGAYSQFEIQRGLPIQKVVKYFEQDGAQWRAKDDLRRAARFEVANLLEPLARLGTFDVIFCRNVLIYFNTQTKTAVLERLARRLAPDGYLFLGAAEAVLGRTDAFAPVEGMHGVWRLKGG